MRDPRGVERGLQGGQMVRGDGFVGEDRDAGARQQRCNGGARRRDEPRAHMYIIGSRPKRDAHRICHISSNASTSGRARKAAITRSVISEIDSPAFASTAISACA